MAKILLIDDDPDVHTVMGTMLRKQGYDVVTATRREDALQKLAEEKPCVILLDVLLSGADGREICRSIKENKDTKNIPVIMFSGHPVAAVQFESYGADDFIPKPLNTEALLQKLSRFTGKELK